MDESGMIHIDDHINPIHYLEESSIAFMDEIKERFELYVHRFNEYRGNQRFSGNNGALIKTFKISNTVNDFMLFRNSLRLIFARKANDLISIAFTANGRDLFAARLTQDDQFGNLGNHEIRAHIGAFNKISWRFNGEVVDVDALVRHYLSEFIRNSAR